MRLKEKMVSEKKLFKTTFDLDSSFKSWDGNGKWGTSIKI